MPASLSKVVINSPNIRYTDETIEANFQYDNTRCEMDEKTGVTQVFPVKSVIRFRTQRKVPKTGLMLVGWGGNNGTTVTGAILANKQRLSWSTKEGIIKANYFGSITQSSTVLIGKDNEGGDVCLPMNELLPMVNPNDLILDGWDISRLSIADAMKRAKVLDYNLQQQLFPLMKEMKPREAIFDPDFIAANQAERADNVIKNKSKWAQVEKIRADIKDFKEKNELDTVIVLWTANTERFTIVTEGIHDTPANLFEAIKRNEKEIAPSTLYAVASILEGCTFINGSPQNTFVPGLIKLAEAKRVFIGGDDFKSGQTKLKSVLVDFLVNAGIKPCSIASYNHLGNNDGFNLSSEKQFRSKEISKSNVIDDMVKSNKILFNGENGLSKPDHCVVIKYVPYVGDSKRAMDEYVSELMLGGHNTIVVHNTCEDSLLASPIILDLAIIAELCQRIEFKVMDVNGKGEYQKMNSVLSMLSYMCKAPLVEDGAPVINSLFRQKAVIDNFLRALLSLPPNNFLDFQYKCSNRALWTEKLAEPVIQTKPVIGEYDKNHNSKPIFANSVKKEITNGIISGH